MTTITATETIAWTKTMSATKAAEYCKNGIETVGLYEWWKGTDHGVVVATGKGEDAEWRIRMMAGRKGKYMAAYYLDLLVQGEWTAMCWGNTISDRKVCAEQIASGNTEGWMNGELGEKVAKLYKNRRIALAPVTHHLNLTLDLCGDTSGMWRMNNADRKMMVDALRDVADRIEQTNGTSGAIKDDANHALGKWIIEVA